MWALDPAGTPRRGEPNLAGLASGPLTLYQIPQFLCDTGQRLADRPQATAAALMDRQPTTGAILLECTNMVPFAADIRAATGLPVYSIYSFVTWFQAGLLPRRFTPVIDDSRF